jgi:hypothetical protein
MNGALRVGTLATSVALVLSWGVLEGAQGHEAGMRDIPARLAPFEYLIGRWNGQGIPKDNPAQQFRGWTETHSWAWIFVKGKPAGLAVTIEGGKLFSTGKLTYDESRKQYCLDANELSSPSGTIRFEGSLDASAKLLVLDQVGVTGKSAPDSGKLRLSIRPNANFVRYTMTQDRQEPGAFQLHHLYEVGLTKEGESFAAGSTTTERPKCIVTGGAATLTLTYQGRRFPICCTGCRDEFNENPEKYVKKAALLSSSETGKGKSNQPASRVSRFEDAFAGDVVGSSDGTAPASKGLAPALPLTKKPAKVEASPDTTSAQPKTQAKPTTQQDAATAAATKQTARAATLLRLGQNLESSGNKTAALAYYRQIVKDLPATPAARTAALRIKALGGD